MSSAYQTVPTGLLLLFVLTLPITTHFRNLLLRAIAGDMSGLVTETAELFLLHRLDLGDSSHTTWLCKLDRSIHSLLLNDLCRTLGSRGRILRAVPSKMTGLFAVKASLNDATSRGKWLFSTHS